MEYVKTDYDGCDYITAGKVYELRDENYITADNGIEIFIDLESSSHIGGRNWEYTAHTPQTGTLKELNVKPGDVVEWPANDTITKPLTVISADVLNQGVFAGEVWANFSDYGDGIFDKEIFTIISRANSRDPELTSPYGDNNHPLPHTTPKTWGEMTDAEKGALLLARENGSELQYKDKYRDFWYDSPVLFCDDFAYRIRPKPSHLPLTVGEYYELENGETWECIFVRGDIAWLSLNNNTAYLFSTSTGGNISQGGGEYNVKGLAQ